MNIEEIDFLKLDLLYCLSLNTSLVQTVVIWGFRGWQRLYGLKAGVSKIGETSKTKLDF